MNYSDQVVTPDSMLKLVNSIMKEQRTVLLKDILEQISNNAVNLSSDNVSRIISVLSRKNKYTFTYKHQDIPALQILQQDIESLKTNKNRNKVSTIIINLETISKKLLDKNYENSVKNDKIYAFINQYDHAKKVKEHTDLAIEFLKIVDIILIDDAKMNNKVEDVKSLLTNVSWD